METTFSADAILFDMDGTLTDSIAAVEAAWGTVALAIGQDPAYIISATRGKHAIDNLAQFKPQIQTHEMDATVQAFEEFILFFADAYAKHGLETTLKDDADKWYRDGRMRSCVQVHLLSNDRAGSERLKLYLPYTQQMNGSSSLPTPSHHTSTRTSALNLAFSLVTRLIR